MKKCQIFFTIVLVSALLCAYQYMNKMESVTLQSNKTDQESTALRRGKAESAQNERHDRIAVIAYMGESDGEARIFLTMLFGSWKFISDRKSELLKPELYRVSNIIDIVVFCTPDACQHVKSQCTVVKSIADIVTDATTPRCWAVHQLEKIDIPYPPLNSYIMCTRRDINMMEKHYKYILRSDYDVFITPSLFLFKTSKKLLFGNGGYSGEFPNKRLKNISKKLGLRHQGFHSIGSTWYGETAFFIKSGKLAFNLTRYMYKNEFIPSLPGLETVDFKKNIEGEWPKWWRPVSSMYGGEMAVNHMVDGVSDKNRGRFDTTSCEMKSVWSGIHVHCWHSDCEFQKFRFTKYMEMIIHSQNGIPGPILHLLVENMYPKNVNNMTIRDYATHVAWYSVGRYLKKWIVKNEPIPEVFDHDKRKI